MFALATVLMIASISTSIADEARSFDVDAGKAVKTLKLFAKQSELGIVFDSRSVKDVRTESVVGLMIPSDALERMLENTPLVFDQDDETGAFAVTLVVIEEEDTSSSTEPLVSQVQHADSVLTTRDEKIEPENTIPMNENKKTIGSLFKGLLALALTSAPNLSAQDDSEEEVFELSPFAVDGSSDDGYRATQTLSGGRMRTDLKDIANQVEVLTAEFLSDWDLKTVDQAMTYTTNVEGAEEFTDANNARYSTGTETYGRIRGLGAANSASGARNFFVTKNRMDGYNIDRLSVASGPNAILFGLGNPGGMIATQIKQANLGGRNPNRGNVDLRFDSEGSFSVDLDYNKVLIDDILALRFAGTHKDTETSRKPNSYEDDRRYLTTTWRPFGKTDGNGTAIRLHYETIDIDNSKAPNKVLFDNASPFFTDGGGVPFDNHGKLNGKGNRSVFDNALPPYLKDDRNGTIYLAPPGNAGSDMVLRNTYGWTEVQIPSKISANGVSPLDDFRWSLPVDGEYGDLYPVDRNFTGDTYLQKHESDIFTAFFEQKLTEDLFFEVAYNKETVDKKSVGYFRGGDFRFFADANAYMPFSDAPNPNVGSLYLDGIPTGSISSNEESELRASLSYELDFTDRSDDSWLRWLGKHNFGALYQDRESLSESEAYFAKITTPELSFLPANAQESSGDSLWGVRSRNFFTRQYLNDANPVATNWANFWEPVDLVYPGTGETFTVGVLDGPGPQRAPIGQVIGVESTSFNWVGKFLDGDMILSYGRRQDDLEQQLYVDDSTQSTRVNRGPEGAWLPFSEREFGEWEPAESGATAAKGAVLRPLGLLGKGDWLSVYWYESNNFNPSLKSLNPLTHERVGANQGIGEEYGFRATLLDSNHRLDFSWNWFQTSDTQAPTSNAFGAKKNDLVFFDRAVGSTYNNAIEGPDGPGNAYDDHLDGIDGVDPMSSGINTYAVIGDTSAKGQEWSLNYNYGGFALRGTLAKNETVSANMGQNWVEWASRRLPVWETMDFDGVGWDQAINEEEGVSLKELHNTWVNARSLGFWEAANGAAVQSLAKYRANINGRYRWDEGALKGFSTGLAMRWRDSAALGYGTTILNAGTSDEIEISDVNQPIWGPDSLLYDAFASYRPDRKILGLKEGSVTFQLNIRNLLDDEQIVPIKASSDGIFRTYQYKEPRTFSFSTKIAF